MTVNVHDRELVEYGIEITNQVGIVTKTTDGRLYTGIRFYFGSAFCDRRGVEVVSVMTLWGTKDLRRVLRKAEALLDEHYGVISEETGSPGFDHE